MPKIVPMIVPMIIPIDNFENMKICRSGVSDNCLKVHDKKHNVGIAGKYISKNIIKIIEIK